MKVYNYGNDYACQLRKKLDKGTKTIEKPVAHAKDENAPQSTEAVGATAPLPADEPGAAEEKAPLRKGRKNKTEETEATEAVVSVSEL